MRNIINGTRKNAIVIRTVHVFDVWRLLFPRPNKPNSLGFSRQKQRWTHYHQWNIKRRGVANMYVENHLGSCRRWQCAVVSTACYCVLKCYTKAMHTKTPRKHSKAISAWVSVCAECVYACLYCCMRIYLNLFLHNELSGNGSPFIHINRLYCIQQEKPQWYNGNRNISNIWWILY